MGKFFRRRYQDLIGNGECLRDNVYIQSTDVDRTLMSAESNLAGFFPPEADEIWNEQLLWQPLPVHTIPETSDYVLAAKKPCSRYTYALKQYKKTAEYKEILERCQPIFKYLEEKSGKSIHTTDDAQFLYDTLWIENLRNMS